MPETLRTYQERGYLSRRGCERLNKVLAECTDLYNAELQLWRDQYKDSGKGDSLYERMKAFTVTRNSDPFWESVSVHVGRGVLIRMEEARKAFYRRCESGEKPGYPRFKSYHRYRTVQVEQTTPAMVRPDKHGYAVRIRGLPVVRLRTGRLLPPAEELKTFRITFRGRRPSVVLTYAVEIESLPKSSSRVGLDMGVLNRITTSDGEKIERRRPDRDDIARKQRRLSACKKGSIRSRRRRRILANAHNRARVKDRGRCHEVTTDLVRRYGLIALEDLDKPKMTRSGGARKRGLNRSILEQSWGRITQQLIYKAASAGRELRFVDPRNTSQRCSSCGAMVNKGLDERRHVCGCGLDIDRDHNAALNILKKALAGGAVPAAAGEAA
ncbi:MAG: IS200/IS605 family element transposase accessory protein TnpB [Chloroflexi bacterium]|nr:IS200/IS605 family element transposase accessory protein TnpB [Chloroflexota bacterium]MYC48237.1 IS200/IS605 family element transposase accessory protein TnpB [Chloroflexota bacterium]